MKKEKLYQFFKRIREEKKLSQVDLAKKIGATRSEICDLEKERRPYTLNLALRIGNVLDVKISEVVERTLQEQVDKAKLKLIVKVS